ncbi:MAG: hypothetical protein V1726_04575 [Methanobacteriota archaeon]
MISITETQLKETSLSCIVGPTNKRYDDNIAVINNTYTKIII